MYTIFTYIDVYIYLICTYVYIPVCIYANVYIYVIYTYIYTYICIYTYQHIHMNVSLSHYPYINEDTHTYICVRLQVYIRDAESQERGSVCVFVYV